MKNVRPVNTSRCFYSCLSQNCNYFNLNILKYSFEHSKVKIITKIPASETLENVDRYTTSNFNPFFSAAVLVARPKTLPLSSHYLA